MPTRAWRAPTRWVWNQDALASREVGILACWHCPGRREGQRAKPTYSTVSKKLTVCKGNTGFISGHVSTKPIFFISFHSLLTFSVLSFCAFSALSSGIQLVNQSLSYTSLNKSAFKRNYFLLAEVQQGGL